MLIRAQRYLSLVRFSHTIFALPFAAVGFTLAVTTPGYSFTVILALKVLLCMIFARTAAMAFNRWTDRHFDAANPRTAVREIPSGQISAASALTFTVINCIAFVVTTWFINEACFWLSFVALAVVLGYSYTKRFTALCHLILGLGLSLAPTGAYLAVTGKFNLIPVLISGGVLCWTAGFDIIYAMQDENFDRTQQLHSIPQAFGGVKALSLSRRLHVASSLFMLAAGVNGHFNMLFYTGWLIFTGMLVWQHRLVKADDLSKVGLAFGTANGIASVIFAVFVIASRISESYM